MNKILLIIEREFLSRVRKKSFIIMTILGPVFIAGFISLAIWMTLKEPESQLALVVDETNVIAGAFENNENVVFSYTEDTLSDVLAEFKESPFTIIVYIPLNLVNSNSIVLHYKKYPSYNVQRYIASEIEKSLDKHKIISFNLDKETYERIKDRLVVNTVDFEKKTDDKFKVEITLVGFFFAVLIYMFIFMYGVQVMRGVIEEKTNRIVEIIISSVKPFQLMMGKIIGIALVGLTQFLLWIILSAGLIFAAQSIILNKKYDSSHLMKQQMTTEMMKENATQVPLDAGMDDVSDLLGRINFPLMISMFIFYFLGGYLLYASLFAAVGAAVDNETDTQQFMAPLTIPLVFGFIVAEFAIQNPEGSAAFWFSIIPFTSPVVMMVRIASGIDAGEVWQVYLSMITLVATFIFTTWFAGKIYRTGILMYGKKASYKELWKWLFY